MTKVKKKGKVATTSVVKLAWNDPKIRRAAKYALNSEATNNKISSEKALINAGVKKEEIGEGKQRKRLLGRVRSQKHLLLKKSQVHFLTNVPDVRMTKNIQVIECPDYIRRGLIQISASVTELIPKPNSPFVSIDDTNLMQFPFFGYDDQRNYPRSLRINYAEHFQNFFSDCGFNNANKGIDLTSIKASIIYTATDDYSKQVPHTDYPLTAITETQNRNGWIGWTAHMPLTTDGSWLHVWSGPGLSTAMKMEFGQCLLLRGDVVHAGGRPMVDRISSFYPRLHFFLPTALQVAPKNKIFLVELDGRTKLEETYKFSEWKPARSHAECSVVTRSRAREMRCG
jgi:hypothetical protein